MQNKVPVRLNTKLITNLSNVLFVSSAEIKATINIPNSTWYHLMENTDGISIQQLLQLANGLHIPVRRFFSTAKVDMIGRREDYVEENYTPCYYDEAALQEVVNTRTTATWQKAADIVGMSRGRLRDSLMAVTRTPVTRFLLVCEVFEIDPFTILIDTNPIKKTGKAGGTPSETAALKQKVEKLSLTVDNLTTKYETLLKRFNKLENDFNVFADFGGSTNMAAESGPENKKCPALHSEGH